MSKKRREFEEYPENIKSLKTGEHLRDMWGNYYTIFSDPAISSPEKKELCAIRWNDLSSLNIGRENLIREMNVRGAEKVKIRFFEPIDYKDEYKGKVFHTIKSNDGQVWISYSWDGAICRIANLTKFQSFAILGKELSKMIKKNGINYMVYQEV